MTLKELKKLCKKMEKEGYEDSILYVLKDGIYHPIEVTLTPNEYGEIVLEVV